MRILFLTQWFQPEPHIKGLPFAKALAERGHEIEVLTGFPNYPQGSVYSGYRIRPYQREELEGIRVHRLALYPSHDKSAWRRSLTYLSFSLSTLLLGPWLVRKPDVVYVYNLVTLGPLAFLLRALSGSKVLLDVQDLWPESITTSKMVSNGAMLNIMQRVCAWVYRSADKLTVLSPGFKEELITRGVSPENIEIIYNWCDETSLQRAAEPSELMKRIRSKKQFIVLFAGTMGTVQGLDTILECAGFCRQKLPQVQFLLIGGGVERQRLEKKAVHMGLANVTFLPPRPMEAMSEIYDIADALIVHLKDDPLFRITIPSKTQASLYRGKPIIMAVRGCAADMISQSGGGILCEPENAVALTQAIAKLCAFSPEERAAMGKAGFRYYRRHLSFASGVRRFEKLMLDLQSPETSPS